MKIWLILLLVIAVLYADDGNEPLKKNVDPFEFNTPKNWRPERIPFPLSFAPDISYKGFEELRFAPGMFDSEAEDYFTYVFFFWIEGKVKLESEEIKKNLEKYYKGLCKAVAKKRELKLDLDAINVVVTKISKENSIRHEYTATIDWYDPFVTGAKLTLNMEINTFHCSGHTVLFACVCPKKKSQKSQNIWNTMHQIRDSFKCKENPKK